MFVVEFGAQSYHLERIDDLAAVLRLESELDAAEKAKQERVIILTRNTRIGEEHSARYFDKYPQLRNRKPRLARVSSLTGIARARAGTAPRSPTTGSSRSATIRTRKTSLAT